MPLGINLGVKLGSTPSPGSPTPAPSEVFNEVPSPPADGSTSIFSFSPPFVAGTTNVYLNGARQLLTQDYTESGSTITFLSPPNAGANLLADYLTP